MLIEKIKEQDLLSFVQITLSQQGKKEVAGYRFQSGDETTPSLLVYKDKNKGYCDYSGRLGSGTIIDFYKNYYNCDNKTAINSLKEHFNLESDEKKVFIKQPKREELVTNFSKYQKFDVNYLNYFLGKRGFSYEQIKTYESNIHKISAEIGFIQGFFIENDIYKDTIIFPCYDESFIIKGVKLRTTDLTKFKDIKSLAVKSTGLLYNPCDLNNEQVIICEGEIDYMILKILGFTSVIGNLGGVQSNMETIKILTKEIKEIVSFYDNDKAGRDANIKLTKELGREIKCIKYPTEDKVDINDLFNRGFNKKEDFDKIILNSKTEKEIYKISEKEDGYYFLKGDYIVRVTDFFIEPIDFLEIDNEKQIMFKIKHKTGDYEEVFSFKDYCDVLSFRKKVKKINPFCNFFDIKLDSLDELIRYVLRDKQAIYTYIVNQKGFIKKFNCWTFKEGIMQNGKFYKYLENKTVNLGLNKIKLDLEDNYFLPTYIEENYNIDIKKHFNYMFGETNGELVLGFLIASLFVNSIHFTAFPILFIFGKKGTGKTTAIELALKILGIENSKNIAESDTRFVDEYNTGRISSLPYWSDEYKNGKKTKEKETFYKTLYDRAGVSRGSITENNLGIKKIEYLSTLILSGEQSPNDDAVFSRTCLVEVSKDRQGKDIYGEIQEQSNKYPYIIKNILENFEDLKDLYIFLLQQINEILKQKGVKDRLLDVYVPIIAGYFIYENYFLKNDEINEEFINKILEKIRDKKEKESEDLLDSFFNKIFYLFQKSFIKYEEHIRIKENKVNLNFSYIYSMYEENSKKEELISKKDLKNYLEKEYKTKRSSMNHLDNSGVWNNTISFDLEKGKYPKVFDDYFNINF